MRKPTGKSKSEMIEYLEYLIENEKAYSQNLRMELNYAYRHYEEDKAKIRDLEAKLYAVQVVFNRFDYSLKQRMDKYPLDYVFATN